MTDKQLNYDLLDEAAKIFKVLSNRHRLNILYYLRNTKKEVSVSEIVKNINDSQPVVSKQLRILTRYHLVSSRKEKNFIYYSLTDPDLISLIDSMVEHVDHTIKEVGKVPDTLHD